MRRIVVVLVAVTATGIFAQTAEPEQKTAARVVALQITKPDPDDKTGSMVQGRLPGTSMHVRLTRPDKYFLKLDKHASKLVIFSDEKKTDLAKSPPTRLAWAWLGHWTQISKDGHHCVFEVRSKSTPAPGAGQLHLKANIVMLCGQDEKTAEQKELLLKKGSKLAAGPVPMEIEEVKEGGWGGVKMTVSLTHTVSDEEIKGDLLRQGREARRAGGDQDGRGILGQRIGRGRQERPGPFDEVGTG